MASEEITIELKPAWKVVSYLGMAVLGGACLYIFYLIPQNFDGSTADYIALIFYSLLFIGVIFSAFYMNNSGIMIDEEGITRQGLFSERTIRFSDIQTISFQPFVISLESDDGKVELGSMTMNTNGDKAMALILEQVKEQDDVSFEVALREKFLKTMKSNPLYQYGVEI